MRVKMTPNLETIRSEESGVRRVIEAYYQYLPALGITLVDEDEDLHVSHAGSTGADCDVAMLHGMYFTADYPAPVWEFGANANIVQAVRSAYAITVPSEWVGEIIRRDMHRIPQVAGHGVDWAGWQHKLSPGNYVIGYAKNRKGLDVCDPTFIRSFAKRFPDTHFLATFAPDNIPENIFVTGLLPHDKMKVYVQQALAYISTTKETFGIGALEALAAGTPVVGFRRGGIVDFVQHGVNGYLAEPDNYDDLAEGLRYVMAHRDILGENARQTSRVFTWERACANVARILQEALEIKQNELRRDAVSVIIPVYRKTPEQLARAVDSVMAQTEPVDEIIVVDDGSDAKDRMDQSGYEKAYNDILAPRGSARTSIVYIWQPNRGVAHARNAGIAYARNPLICCLDADDAIAPLFIEVCAAALREDRSLGVAYTGLWAIKPDGEEGLSTWPGKYDYDLFLRKKNQVPTCAVFRRRLWQQLGGYRQRYAPKGAGAEDAEFFLRAGAMGWGGKQVTNVGLFYYSWLSGQVTGDASYREVDWLAWHPWTRDNIHPFASQATPRRMSHPVMQYDEPSVSVIIPVGPDHARYLVDALDSLEAQTFRRWEVIIVWDAAATDDEVEWIQVSFPFARHVHPERMGRGAGAARNTGVLHARGKMLLFLDADDWLYPTFLERAIDRWNQTGAGVYSDYVGLATVKDPAQLSEAMQYNLLSYNERRQEAVIKHQAADFDCAKVAEQPDNPPHIFCNVTTLIPKAWHLEIGGFDESLESWEDVLYWYMMAWSGKCFTRLEEPLMVYRFHTGSRRDSGTKKWDSLLTHISRVKDRFLNGVDPMCNCDKPTNQAQAASMGNGFQAQTLQSQAAGARSVKGMVDSDYVMINYMHPNRGRHPVSGTEGRSYGHRASGDQFLVHKRDIELFPHLFAPVATLVARPEAEIRPTAPAAPRAWQPPSPPPAPPVVALANDKDDEDDPFTVTSDLAIDPQGLPGVTPAVARALEDAGLTTLLAILEAGEEGLQKVQGVGPSRAKAIMKYVTTLPR